MDGKNGVLAMSLSLSILIKALDVISTKEFVKGLF